MLDKVIQCDPGVYNLPVTRPDLRGYVHIALRGTFPQVVRATCHCRLSVHGPTVTSNNRSPTIRTDAMAPVST